MIAPGNTAPAIVRPRFREADALERTILTFRDANTVRWIRMPDGTLKEQERATAHDSILAALGRPIPAPVQAALPTGPAGQAEQPEAHGTR
jgi:hypothetical protein